MSEQMDLTERKLSRVDKFAGRIVTVHVDTVALPGGGTSTREVVDHPGEDPYEAGLRELKEETGAVPGRYEPLGRILPSPGCYGETLHLYLARDLKMGEQHLDEDEFLNVERVPFGEMVRRCLDGEIEDAKTVAAVLKAKLLLNL